MENINIAFATYDKLPGFSQDDQLAAGALLKRGVQTQPVPWTTKENWNRYDAVVVRSCWDYHLQPEKFLTWLDHLDSLSVPVLNSSEIIRANLHKGYLELLGKSGIAVPRTLYLKKGATIDLCNTLTQMNWGRAVIKPCVSASSYKTWVTTPGTAHEDNGIFNHMLAYSDFMVQEFISEVCERGEMSLIFIDRRYAHGVLKRTSAGEFRVQESFGGTTSPFIPRQDMIDAAQNILNTVTGELLYARIDGVERDGKFCLMELELIEPVLFFRHSAEAVNMFADQVVAMIQKEYKM